MRFCEFELSNGKRILFNTEKIEVVIEHGSVPGHTFIFTGSDSWELSTPISTVMDRIRLATT